MKQNENIVIKTSKGMIVILSVLLISVIGLAGYTIYDNLNESEPKIKEEEKINVETNNIQEENNVEQETDNSTYLKTATDVYTNAYNMINKGESFIYNETELSKYFTRKAIDKIYKSSVNVNADLSQGIFFTGVFGKVNQGLRNITFVSATEDTIVVNAQLTNNQYGDNDAYPMYIILKKDSNTYKIDLFE